MTDSKPNDALGGANLSPESIERAGRLIRSRIQGRTERQRHARERAGNNPGNQDSGMGRSGNEVRGKRE